MRCLRPSGFVALAWLLVAGPLPAQVQINEIMQNPLAVLDAAGEWFELYNSTTSPVDLDGWTVRDDDSDSFVIAGPLVLPARGFLVLGRNQDGGSNGGVVVDYQYTGMDLGNGSDELVLLDTGLNEIDRVTWDDGATFPDPDGESMEFAKDPGLDNNTGATWCGGYLLYGAGDRGTPGGAKYCCLSESCIYLEVDVTTPETLRATLHNSIDDHVRFAYTSTATDTWDILDMADEDPTDDSRVLDIYRNASFPRPAAITTTTTGSTAGRRATASRTTPASAGRRTATVTTSSS
jgi:Lamin Tail Domain